MIPILSIKNISKHYRGVIALDEVSLDIHTGEVVALVGPNGAGKSTLLNVVAGLTRPDTGEVTFNSSRISWFRPFKHFRAPQNMGFLMQHTRVVESLSPIDNVRIGLQPGNGRSLIKAVIFPRHQAWRSEADAIQEEFEAFLARSVSDSALLSVGQKRILELLRLRKGLPIALLLDEPTAGLHASSIAELIELIDAFRKNGCAVLLCEHNLDFVRSISDRIVRMNKGAIATQSDNQRIDLWVDIHAQPIRSADQTATVERRTDNPLISIVDLQGGYDSGAIFHSLSFEMYTSEVISFVGPNGSGKSTALKAIAGLLPWRRGQVFRDGNNEITQRLLGEHRGVSMVLQSHRIFDRLTIEENLLLAANKLDKRERENAISHACKYFPELINIAHNRPAAQLSGGQQQMLVLVQGLITNPRVLLLDEPTAGLSPPVVRDVEYVISQLKSDGISLIITEHNMNFVRAVSDRVFEFRIGEKPQEISLER